MSSKTRSFPIFKVIFFISLAFAGIIAFDISKHGSFKASSSGRFAKDIGIYPHVEQGIKQSKVYYNHTYDWTVKNVPVYYKIAVDTSRPYAKLFSEYAMIAFKQVQHAINVIWNYVADKLPFISQWIEVYAPGLAKKEFWSNIFDNVARYSEIFLRFCLKLIIEGSFYFMVAIETTVNWLQKNVFTGNLSSENLQKYAIQGIDSAFAYATKAVFWVQNKFVSIYG